MCQLRVTQNFKHNIKCNSVQNEMRHITVFIPIQNLTCYFLAKCSHCMDMILTNQTMNMDKRNGVNESFNISIYLYFWGVDVCHWTICPVFFPHKYLL